MTILSAQNIIQKKQRTPLILGSIVLVLIIVTMQDVLHAQRNQYSFYLSESFLFNSYWLWFFPITCIVRPFFKPKETQAIKTFFLIQICSFILSASVLHVLAYTFTVFGISYFFYQATYDIPKMLGYTLSHDFYKYIFIYGSVGIFYLRAGYFQKKEPLEEKKQTISAIVVGNSRNNEIIPITDIILIKSSSPYIALHTSKRVHLHTEALKSILEKLPSDRFVQVHKSTIVNTQRVVSYKSRLNGDYDILLDDGQEVRLSRNYAVHFKKIFVADSSS